MTSAMPSRSMSFIVNTVTLAARTISFSRSSRLRMPTNTVCFACTAGASPAKCASSAGSEPSRAASGMPCTLPDPLDAGLFMSPCASTQIKPSGLP